LNNTLKDGFADRQKTANAARQALLAKFKPAEARPSQEPLNREQERAATLIRIREERAQARIAKAEAAAAALAADVEAQAALEAAELEAKRGQRRERKALSAADQKAKRDARYAARQARR